MGDVGVEAHGEFVADEVDVAVELVRVFAHEFFAAVGAVEMVVAAVAVGETCVYS